MGDKTIVRHEERSSVPELLFHQANTLKRDPGTYIYLQKKYSRGVKW